MRKLITILILGTMLTGCATVRRTSYLDRLRDMTIPEIDLRQLPVQDAVQALRTEWMRQTGTEMPVAEIIEHVEYSDPKERLVTFRAKHISFLEALRLVTCLSGYHISFKENALVLADIWPGEFKYFEWKLDAGTKAELKLGDKPDVETLQAALASRGVDFSTGDMKITFLSDDLVVIGGFTENAELAKAILVLATSGYDVRKQETSQQEVSQPSARGNGIPSPQP